MEIVLFGMLFAIIWALTRTPKSESDVANERYIKEAYAKLADQRARERAERPEPELLSEPPRRAHNILCPCEECKTWKS